MEENNNYWDYISTQEQAEANESIKDLLKESFDYFKVYLDQLFYIESNFIYLNLVCDLQQHRIAEIYGLSQLGVSKRVRSGLRKIDTLLKRPESDRNIIRTDFKNFFNSSLSETLIIYYQVKTFALTSTILGENSSSIRNKILLAIDILTELSETKDGTEFTNVLSKTKDCSSLYNYFKSLKTSSDFHLLERTKAFRYKEYLNIIITQYNYGDYIFKANSTLGME